jgi:NAD+ synthase (glutamine-hydrolysing)
VLGLPLMREDQRFNAAVVLRDGAVIAEYHKRELPNYSVFDEKRYFAAGDDAVVFEQSGVSFGLAICEDVWFDAPVADLAGAGAHVILNLNASPFNSGKTRERERTVVELCREHSVSMLYANQVGGQDELVFDGGSFVINALGDVQLRCQQFEEQIAIVELDDQAQPIKQAIAEPLSDEAEIYGALVQGVRDYVTKNGFKGAVLGLSGGIDSAVTLAIAVDALGAENLEVVLMPSRYTSDMSNEDAAEQAKTQGVDYQTIPIEPAFNAFLEMLSASFDGLTADVTEENIQARCRGVLLMAISNKRGRMLLTTGNKSEMSVGYATLYGDMNGGFAPLKDVPKLLVYRLARWINRNGEIIPDRVITRPPSAELRPDQKDSDSLPDYEVLDAIIERYVELDQCVEKIVAEMGFDQAEVERITRLIDLNEYKRRQSAPGVKITQRAYGRDRRYPIVNGF